MAAGIITMIFSLTNGQGTERGSVSRIIVYNADEGMDAETRAHLQRCFAGEVPGSEPCQWCGGLHRRECGRVKKIIYHPTDPEVIREIEFWADVDWDHSKVIWPEDCF